MESSFICMTYFSKIMATAWQRVDKTRERLQALVSELLVRKRAPYVPYRHTSALQGRECASDSPSLSGVMGSAGQGKGVKDQNFLREKKNITFQPSIFSSD